MTRAPSIKITVHTEPQMDFVEPVRVVFTESLSITERKLPKAIKRLPSDSVY
jgi:hypothetical protein